ncbi:hypothetical protein JX266_008199 [Neoarthrinium moseri]|uniref:uncharacterized protein n=1 Tax=Neoarthrinium moseri TaxID=1658444 RepID=UPI001FDCD05B|nr:uncharacterized protein JN550_006265 [Neoarthrinium moseri]KAI1845588.1 hypothetical protein JX266_008199 [Neoarthrinium moseri]KAI1868690.1 hypothetical protein JN550_006265 [Neoarthrinium moseri]
MASSSRSPQYSKISGAYSPTSSEFLDESVNSEEDEAVLERFQPSLKPGYHYKARSKAVMWIQNGSALLLGVLIAIVILTPLTPAALRATDSQNFVQRQEEVASQSSCGNSTAEAKELGCEYDPSLLNWVKPYCRFDDISDQFVRLPIHELYQDEEMKQPMDLSYILSGEFAHAYDYLEHHKGHCLNAWKTLTEASLQLGPTQQEVLVSSRALSWEHTVHCSEGVIIPNMNSPWRTKPHISFWVGFANCHLLRLP